VDLRRSQQNGCGEVEECFHGRDEIGNTVMCRLSRTGHGMSSISLKAPAS